MFVALIGALGMVGVVFQIPVLVFLRDGYPAMRLPTAVMLIGCGLSLVPAAFLRWKADTRLYLQSLSSMFVFMIVACLTLYWCAVVNTVARSQIVLDADHMVPSVGTLAAIALFASAMIYRTIAAYRGLNCVPSVWVSAIIMAIGSAALFGHAANVPYIAWVVPPYSTGMAIHTAIAITALGVGMFLMPRPKVRKGA